MPLIAGQFETKPGVIRLLPKFHGLESKSAYLHLKEFEEVRAAIQLRNVGAKDENSSSGGRSGLPLKRYVAGDT